MTSDQEKRQGERDGRLIEVEGDRVGVRFERRLAHPPERV